jgi:hypothetical protein
MHTGTIAVGRRLTARSAQHPEDAMTRTGRRFVFAVAALLAWPVAGDAQQPIEPKTPAATRTVNLTLEQRHVIRELVKDLKVIPTGSDSKVAAGDEIPAKVELHPVPPLLAEKVPQIKAHRFYVTQSQIVLVDPQDPKVAEVID